MLHITSGHNGRVKEILALRERRGRDEMALFLIEGYREIKRAVDAGRRIDTFFYCEEFFLGDNEWELLHAAGGEPISCSKSVFEKISYRDRPDGLLAVAPQMHLGRSDLEQLLQHRRTPLLLALERIEKPGNLGTMLRSADAAGVDAVLVLDSTTDIHNPNVVRASVGTLFTQPVIEMTSLEALSLFRNAQIQSVAATPHATLEFTSAPLAGPLAIVVGAEQYGLSSLWMEQADLQIRIPMRGKADSLNVSSAATLVLYEAVRQRRSHCIL